MEQLRFHIINGMSKDEPYTVYTYDSTINNILIPFSFVAGINMKDMDKHKSCNI